MTNKRLIQAVTKRLFAYETIKYTNTNIDCSYVFLQGHCLLNFKNKIHVSFFDNSVIVWDSTNEQKKVAVKIKEISPKHSVYIRVYKKTFDDIEILN